VKKLLFLFLFSLLFANDVKILQFKQDNNDVNLSFIFKNSVRDFKVYIKDGNRTIESRIDKNFSNSAIFLIDTSLSMKKYSKNIKSLIAKITKKLSSNTEILIAGFDRNIKIIKGFDEPFTKDTLKKLIVNGKVTELYKSGIEAINLLKKQHITRKILVIFSDGGAEDTAYSVNDLIEEAKKNNVTILSIGYNDSVRLQSIERPAIESWGKLWLANKNNFLDEFLLFFNNGANISFENNFITETGRKELTLLVKNSDEIFKKNFTIKTEIKKSGDMFIYITILILLVLIVFLIYWKKNRQKKTSLSIKKNKKESGILAYLIDDSGKKYPIVELNTSIGRNKSNDIVIEGSYISNFHADIILKNGKFFIIDKNSTNGVSINIPISENNKINKVQLNNNDEVYLGPLKLKFVIKDENETN